MHMPMVYDIEVTLTGICTKKKKKLNAGNNLVNIQEMEKRNWWLLNTLSNFKYSIWFTLASVLWVIIANICWELHYVPRGCFKCFIVIKSFNSHLVFTALCNSSITIPFYSWQNWVTEKLNESPKIAQLSDEAGIWMQAIRGQSPHSFFFFLSFSFYFFFVRRHAACRISVPRPGIEPGPSAVKAQSPNHWATGEFPEPTLLSTHRAYFSNGDTEA